MDIDRKIIELLQLGTRMEVPREIHGGLMHRMYHIVTDKGEFALKKLNPGVMQRPEALRNMIVSEKIAKAFTGIVPAVAALETDGRQVHLLEGGYYMVYPWVQGRSIYPPDIKEANCRTMGQMLGRMHEAGAENDGAPKQEAQEACDWSVLCNFDAPWARQLSDALPGLIDLEQRAIAAQRLLNENQVISHRDLDPKNVLWQGEEPLLIDWEAAGYVNPWQEVCENLLYWADDGKGGLCKTHFQAFLAGYGERQVLDQVPWEKALESGVLGMIGWLHYNVRRALGLEAADEAEKALGIRQTEDTLKALNAWERKKNTILSWIQEMKSRC
ncbi:MAG: phosphotransferase [Clostridia bacterium]|nr:phosphotransferase [Clostridia bacterium]